VLDVPSKILLMLQQHLLGNHYHFASSSFPIHFIWLGEIISKGHSKSIKDNIVPYQKKYRHIL